MSTSHADDPLHERVEQFALLQLPGQPIGMHMGTYYLVNDLWAEIERLRDWLIAATGGEGWKLVPVEPTELMWMCGQKSGTYTDSNGELMCISGRSAVACYRAMLSAAPQVGE